MRRTIWVVPAAIILFSSLAFGSYSYYLYENLYTPNWSNWNTDGNPITPVWYSPGNYGGINAADYMLNPIYGNHHNGTEERLTIRQDPANPGAAIEAYMGGAWDSSNGFFAGYTFSIGLTSGSTYVYLYRSWTDITWGTPYRLMLASASGTAHDGMQVRAVVRPYGGSGVQIYVYIDNVQIMSYYDSAPPPCGAPTWIQPGYGLYGFGIGYASGGTLISEADLGDIDTIAPNQVPATGIGVSTTTNQVAIQWPATTDDPNGTGVYEYQLARNGQFVANTTGLSYTDTAGISPSSTYNYTITAIDFHGNQASTPFAAVTPGIGTNPPYPSVTPEGRRVGVRPTAAYWGSGGENIDVMSGNLNFALPLLKAQGRGGWGVTFNLAYNSQLWKEDSGGMWLFDGDVGYGIGWKLQAGSITPVWNPGNMSTAYYLYTDSTGAEYNLNQNNGNIWSSQESVYVYFDANADILHFRDGSFWYFGCVSAPGEADQGVMHPTIMEDTNGNQILIRYMQSPGANWTESSARITQIEDVRATNQGSSYASYGFTYNSDTVPHLTSISNYIGTGEAYTFAYSENQPLVSGINGASFGTTTLLDSATVKNLGATHTFTYDGSGEITQVTLPYNGYLAYAYRNMTYSSGRTYREVQYRYLSKDGTLASQTTYPFSHEASPGPNVHQYTILDDPGGVGEKYWAFGTSGVGMGLVTQYQGRQLPGPVNKTENDFTWAQDSIGNSYIATTLSTLDSGQSYQAQKETTQTVDIYGNVTQVQNYNFGNLSTPARTYTYTYLNSSAYLSKYIYNRLTGASVTNGTTNITLAANTYDLVGFQNPCNIAALTTLTGLREWDTTYSPSGVTTRGNLDVSTTPSGYSCINYDETGNTTSVTRNGLAVQVSTASSNNFAAPAQLTTGSLTTNLSWSTFLGLTNETGPNGDSASTYYDQYARQSSTTSPFGATTSYTYSSPPYSSSAPPTITATTNGRWTRQTLDGLGRTILTETGDANGTKSQAQTVYGSCGCSPTGKMMQTAMPHVVGGTPVYTTYSYDGIGRTLSVVSPDGASTTTYSYQGNLVTATDPAGKQKTFTMDAFGNLTQVQEPNPQGGSAYVTTYSYDLLNNLSQVSMPRPTGTQTRTFVYNGPYLMSATNPENGTVSYTYNNIYKVATKTDAKGQQVQYTYDSYGRLTQVHRFVPQNGQLVENTCQEELYSYDYNPYDSSYSGYYTAGRLTAVQYYFCAPYPVYGGNSTFTDMYNYSQAGGKTGKRLQVTRPVGSGNSTVNLDGSYTYDNEGRMTAEQYPSWDGAAGPNLGYAYDTMGRLNTLTDLTAQSAIISGTTYGPSNELLTMSGLVTETRTYNSMLQLLSLVASASAGPTVNLTYAYSATQNNGKITSQTDNISGEQVVYTYDALNRLASAAATSNSWGQSFSYDGFGNLTGQTVTAGSAPSYSVTPDPSTNHLGGEDANGNAPYSNDANGTNYVMAYDVENRYTGSLTSTGSFAYGYAPGNKRVYRGVANGSTLATDEVTYWSATGQKLATYEMVFSGSQWIATQTGTYEWFGRKLIKNANGYVATDGLGSIGHFYPYGLEKPSATTNGTEKFTGYLRDAETGLDYAKNRYHDPGTGRFMTPDPYIASVGPADPRSWNRYTYTRGDPVNRVDRSGLDDCDKDSSDPNCDGGQGGSCFEATYCDAGGGDPGGGDGGGCFVESGCEDPGPGGGGGDPGGGGQPQAPPPCPPIYQAWINTYGAYAVATGLSEANVLALSAIESGWGGGRFATQGKDFFNLETIWKPGTPKPGPKFAYQNGWLQAKEMFTSGPYKGEYALVATYNSASDSFESFAAKLGTYFTDVTDPATFGNIAVKHGEYGGRGANFVNTALTFMDCLQ